MLTGYPSISVRQVFIKNCQTKVSTIYTGKVPLSMQMLLSHHLQLKDLAASHKMLHCKAHLSVMYF